MQNLSASTICGLCLSVALNIVGFSNFSTQATPSPTNPDNLFSNANEILDESPKPGNGRRETKAIAQADSRQGSSPIRGNGRRDSQDHTPLGA